MSPIDMLDQSLAVDDYVVLYNNAYQIIEAGLS